LTVSAAEETGRLNLAGVQHPAPWGRLLRGASPPLVSPPGVRDESNSRDARVVNGIFTDYPVGC